MMKNRNTRAVCLLFTAATLFEACKKDNEVTNSGTTTTTTTITPPNTPVTASTQGFFLDNNWQAKTFTVPSSTTGASKPTTSSIKVNVDMSNVITKISPTMFGNNTNPFMGQMVSDAPLINYLKDLSPNILRFPGGSLSDIYFWNAASQAPADAPAQLLNAQGVASAAGYWFGNNTANWTMTLDNYYAALKLTNATGLITVNYAYARYGTGPTPVATAAHLAAQWVRYDNGRTKYWEIGNELYGNWEASYRINTSTNQDGQPATITGSLYGQHFKVFADSMRKAASEVGATIKIGIVLEELASTASNAFPTWDADVLGQAGNTADYFIVHNYFTPYNTNFAAADILSTPETVPPSIMSYVKAQAQGAGVTQVPIALTEWNIQATGSMQNVSNIAGLHAAMTLGSVIQNQFGEASRWDLANGWSNGDDQGMFNNPYNSDIEPNAPAWNARPAFFYMYFFQKMFGDQMVNSTVTGASSIVSYASSYSSGESGIFVANTSSAQQTVTINISNFSMGSSYYFYVLNGGTDNGAFSRQVLVNSIGPSGISGGPANYSSIPAYTASTSGGINVTIPGYGAVFMVVAKK